MNIVNYLRFKLFYHELSKLINDKDNIKLFLSNKEITTSYKNDKLKINNFINMIKDYRPIFNNTESDISNINVRNINILFNLMKENKEDKFINYIRERMIRLEDNNLNYEVFKLENFNEFREAADTCSINISDPLMGKVVNKGYTNNFIKMANKFSDKMYSIIRNNTNLDFLNDKYFQVIYDNEIIMEKPLLDLINYNFNIIYQIIDDNCYEGFKYTLNNIPSSYKCLTKANVCTKLLNLDFINNMGLDYLKILYDNGYFNNVNNESTIFKIADAHNYELIKDIINIDPNHKYCDFSSVKDDDINKNIINVKNLGALNKKDVILNKIFGMPIGEVQNIILLFEALSDIKLPEEYINKYQEIYQIINKINTISSDEELISYGNSLDTHKKEEYGKLIKEMENEGNKLLKEAFVDELKKDNNNVELKTVIINDGPYKDKEIKICEFTGQPFMMLTHAVNTDRNGNGKYAKELVDDPMRWNEIESGSNHISMSLISDEHLATFNTPDLIFGFSNIPASSLKYMSPIDAGIDLNVPEDEEFNMREIISSSKMNTIVTPKRMMMKTIEVHQMSSYNEIGLLRKNAITHERLKPDYLVCFNGLNDTAINAAIKFDIPIYIIDSKIYLDRIKSNNKNEDQISENTIKM